MKRCILALITIMLAGITGFSQRSESEIALKEYFADAEFFLTREFYKDALNDFIQVYKRGYQNNFNINYRIGVCYLGIPGQKDKAIPYLEKAREGVSEKYRESSLNEQYAPIDVYLYLGNAYRVNDRLKEAIESYNRYKELLPEDEEDLHKYTDQQIEACNIASEFMSDPIEVTFVNLGEIINSSSNDYRAVLSHDGMTVAYMQALPFYDAVFTSEFSEGAWARPTNITPQIMSDGNQYVSCFARDGQVLYLSREDEFNSDIYVSRLENNRWTQSLPVEAVNTKYWESHASVSNDGKTMVFASNRKGGFGAMDLYITTRNAQGQWGEPRNLGEAVNTLLNEDTPFLTADGNTLFFSSQGYTSMGGYDIFKVSRDAEGKWGVPENLGFPVNTTDDDLFFYPTDDGKNGMMARILPDGYGEMDIYRVVLTSIEPEPVAVVVEEEPEIQPEPEQEPEAEETPVPVVVPAPVKITTLQLSPVLFNFDRSSITPEAKEQLDKLAAIMQKEKEMKLILVGYADPLGPETYNQRLSEKRAVTVLDYLAQKGIDKSRLQAVGKGETNFIAPNTKPDGSDNPEGRKYNRRVEFEFSNIPEERLKIERVDPVPDNLKE